MKILKCPKCNTKREVDDNTVLMACYVCQVSMEVVDGTRTSE